MVGFKISDFQDNIYKKKSTAYVTKLVTLNYSRTLHY